MTARTLVLFTLAVVLAVILTLIGYYWPIVWLVYIFKPIATVLLSLIAISSWISNRSAYAQWIVVGLVFSLLGDVLLMWPNHYFLAGLAAFLVTHVAYLVAFTRDCKFPARLFIWFAYVVAAIACYALLLPTLPRGLRIPVAAYTALLSTMASQAMGRFLATETSYARRAALGALLFLLSDLLLAFDRFRSPLLWSTVLILVPYYIGQWLIASSAPCARRLVQAQGQM